MKISAKVSFDSISETPSVHFMVCALFFFFFILHFIIFFVYFSHLKADEVVK